ncbi:hypothetical protein ACFLZH_03225 [Patescibacteria group bacterium]
MNKNNYFNDITELFIKAKKAENIEVDPHSKAATREMLSFNIDKIKTGKTPAEPKQGFWKTWKKQLIGVPASLLALFVVVFAAQNMQIAIPKEDFTPSDTQEELAADSIYSETEIVYESDSPIIEDVEPELMVIDYNESQPTYYTPKPQVPVQEPQTPAPAQEILPTHQDTPKEDKTEQFTVQSAQKLPTNEISTGGGADDQSTDPQTSQPDPQPDPQPDQQFINDDSTQDQTTTPDTYTPIYPNASETPAGTVNNLMDGEILIDQQIDPIDKEGNKQTDSFTHFREPFSPTKPDFDINALEKTENPDNLSSVNVHYLNDAQVAVEVTTKTNETRWYLYEEIDGNWTVTQKFD